MHVHWLSQLYRDKQFDLFLSILRFISYLRFCCREIVGTYPAEFRQDYLKETGFGTGKESPMAFDAFIKPGSTSEKSGGTIPSKTLIIYLSDAPGLSKNLKHFAM